MEIMQKAGNVPIVEIADTASEEQHQCGRQFVKRVERLLVIHIHAHHLYVRMTLTDDSPCLGERTFAYVHRDIGDAIAM